VHRDTIVYSDSFLHPEFSISYFIFSLINVGVLVKTSGINACTKDTTEPDKNKKEIFIANLKCWK